MAVITPYLHSNPGAPAVIFLDFRGDDDASHNNGPYDNVAAIPQIWSSVAERFSPFNIDVTTEPTPSVPNYSIRAIISGNNTWSGRAVGGFCSVQAFHYSDAYQNNAYIFPQNLSNDPHIIAMATAHELGHALDLNHHAQWDANGNKLSEYDPGNGVVAPVMGVAYYSQRAVWSNAANSFSADYFQDDLAILSGTGIGVNWAGQTNPFHYRPQDHGQDIAHADSFINVNDNLTASGIIETTSDKDTFRFDSPGGVFSVLMKVAQYDAMLHGKLELFDAANNLLATAADPNTLSQSINISLAAGSYYLAAESFGAYGDLGQYTIVATVPEPKVFLAPAIVYFALMARRRRK